MNFSAEEVMQYVEEEDVKFIRLAFCDVYGVQKNLAIQPSELKRAFRHGAALDASAIPGFDRGFSSDLFLRPDPSTLARLPWRPESGKVVRMFCDILTPDGEIFSCDTRNILKKAAQKARTQGLYFDLGSQMEFYLFKTDDNGEPVSIPYDNAGYMDIAPIDKGENIRREICLTLEQMGIHPESSHHEEGPGQNEIDFVCADPLTAADNAVTFVSIVKTVAARNGLYADFSPMPLKDMPGSGMHINISMGSVESLPFVMAGIMDKIREMTVFLNPLNSSYERFGKAKAPSHIAWARENRSQLIRIPASFGAQPRAELRSADPMANPYLAFTLIIHAGLYGLQNALELPPASEVSFINASDSETGAYQKLPASRAEASRLAQNSDFIREIFPGEIISAYCHTFS